MRLRFSDISRIALLLVSIGQSMPSSSLSNQSRPRICGKRVGSAWNMSVIHWALEPPVSVDAVSPMIIGLLGAIVVVISS